ncbi:MAG: hypothetical protein QM647_04835 [Asticcacaulis sp.]|uniref:hypothetical protein n=1 Tax=Asticcacaulis sp. TaxID=1872648 RepID=UPI0039E24717
MQRPSKPTAASISYAQAPYISAFMARQDFERLFGTQGHKRVAADNRKLPFIYTLGAMTVYCTIFWVAVFKIIF